MLSVFDRKEYGAAITAAPLRGAGGRGMCADARGLAGPPGLAAGLPYPARRPLRRGDPRRAAPHVGEIIKFTSRSSEPNELVMRKRKAEAIEKMATEAALNAMSADNVAQTVTPSSKQDNLLNREWHRIASRISSRVEHCGVHHLLWSHRTICATAQ